MQRYFLSGNYQPQPQFKVTGEPYHHIVRVMRMAPKDQAYLVFENQIAIRAELEEITDEAVYFREIEKEQQEKELPIHVTIASGYPKGDKLDLVVQKGTELGAAAFLGFPAQTSVVKWDDKKLSKKQQRLSKIAQEAAEQSQRQMTPTVTLLQSAQEFEQKLTNYDVVIVAYEESAKQGETAMLAQVLQGVKSGQRVLAVFGPEGGLTPEEIQHFEASGSKICGLGPRILRTETAPLYFLSAVSYQLELARM